MDSHETKTVSSFKVKRLSNKVTTKLPLLGTTV